MNYTEMLFNRDERLVNLLNQADSKNLELIEEINNREDEIERLQRQKEELQVNGLRQETLFKLEIERLNNIINEITIFIKHDYFKAREFKEKIQRSELSQGDYPIAYYHADWLEDITDVYLNKLQELKGSDKE